MDAELYAQKDNPMAWALATWMRRPRKGRARLRLLLQEKILRNVEEEEYRNVLIETVRTYFRLNEQDEAEESRMIQEELDAEIREEMLTAFDKLRLEGEQIGIQKGEQIGIQKGERLALHESLSAVLESRFGPLPAGIQSRFRKIEDLGSLRNLISRAAVASTLQEVLHVLEQGSKNSN